MVRAEGTASVSTLTAPLLFHGRARSRRERTEHVGWWVQPVVRSTLKTLYDTVQQQANTIRQLQRTVAQKTEPSDLSALEQQVPAPPTAAKAARNLTFVELHQSAVLCAWKHACAHTPVHGDGWARESSRLSKRAV